MVLVEDTDSGEVIGVLEHHRRYSVTGFNWGYDGAGPRELARSLLAATLGPGARCPECRDLRSGGCDRCADGLRSNLPDVELVREVVSRLGSSWTLHDDQLRVWCNERGFPSGLT